MADSKLIPSCTPEFIVSFVPLPMSMLRSYTIILHLKMCAYKVLKSTTYVINIIFIYLSRILVLARSYLSSICGKCASSSQDAPQPNTLAKSLPVPNGNTPTWHCT